MISCIHTLNMHLKVRKKIMAVLHFMTYQLYILNFVPLYGSLLYCKCMRRVFKMVNPNHEMDRCDFQLYEESYNLEILQ